LSTRNDTLVITEFACHRCCSAFPLSLMIAGFDVAGAFAEVA
jgi:hypothetical protein